MPAHYELCSFCQSVGAVDDMTPIHIEDKNGVPHLFYFHNDQVNQCLRYKLEELRKQFPITAPQ